MKRPRNAGLIKTFTHSSLVHQEVSNHRNFATLWMLWEAWNDLVLNKKFWSFSEVHCAALAFFLQRLQEHELSIPSIITATKQAPRNVPVLCTCMFSSIQRREAISRCLYRPAGRLILRCKLLEPSIWWAGAMWLSFQILVDAAKANT
jgi:hypothetical protein